MKFQHFYSGLWGKYDFNIHNVSILGVLLLGYDVKRVEVEKFVKICDQLLNIKASDVNVYKSGPLREI